MKVPVHLPNILITGANGQLGSSLALLCNSKDANFFFTDVAELDVTSKSSVEKYISKNKIDIVINCAAYTNVEKAEDEPEIAEKLNATAPSYLAQSCLKHSAFLIHISTDFVFGGGAKRKQPITERVKPAPLNVYGASKLQGEENIKASGCNYLIIRTSWLFSEFGGNFVKTILALLSSKSEIKVVDDQKGTPTYAGDLAKAVYRIAMKVAENKENIRRFVGLNQIYNYSNLGECTWYEFAVKIQQFAKVKLSATAVARKASGKRAQTCHVLPCTSAEFPSKAVRPKYSVLSKEKIRKHFSLTIPAWQTSLKKCLKNL